MYYLLLHNKSPQHSLALHKHIHTVMVPVAQDPGHGIRNLLPQGSHKAVLKGWARLAISAFGVAKERSASKLTHVAIAGLRASKAIGRMGSVPC